ncbi:GNAT family N-acetyltransferase [Limnobacter humi]|uniref:GNAT family N-acetyltransferase n=1 Tax=Limnobacter humi TaxID=1778671 RepID=A0ABT1WJN8_9BURK|nr:GNAT family N-acetyltransferase [Limnobacter humi]MCQ8897731.1 GNAT family N-acetyltransferase [Limnobacter humi]
MTTIRPAHLADIPAIVDVHIQAFPGFFLTLMGRPFLRLLYLGFLQSAQGMVYVAVNAQGDVLGFVAGTAQPQGFFGQLLRKQWFRFGLAAVWPLCRRPSLVAIKLWSALFYRGETLPDLPNAALLSSLGVHPQAHRQGLGRQLVAAFVAWSAQHGCPAVYLTTDQSNNTKANTFYLECGFQLAGTCKRPPNRILNRYLLRIQP